MYLVVSPVVSSAVFLECVPPSPICPTRGVPYEAVACGGMVVGFKPNHASGVVSKGPSSEKQLHAR